MVTLKLSLDRHKSIHAKNRYGSTRSRSPHWNKGLASRSSSFSVEKEPRQPLGRLQRRSGRLEEKSFLPIGIWTPECPARNLVTRQAGQAQRRDPCKTCLLREFYSQAPPPRAAGSDPNDPLVLSAQLRGWTSQCNTRDRSHGECTRNARCAVLRRLKPELFLANIIRVGGHKTDRQTPWRGRFQRG
jgi:hypothetical protein